MKACVWHCLSAHGHMDEGMHVHVPYDTAMILGRIKLADAHADQL